MTLYNVSTFYWVKCNKSRSLALWQTHIVLCRKLVWSEEIIVVVFHVWRVLTWNGFFGSREKVQHIISKHRRHILCTFVASICKSSFEVLCGYKNAYLHLTIWCNHSQKYINNFHGVNKLWNYLFEDNFYCRKLWKKMWISINAKYLSLIL